MKYLYSVRQQMLPPQVIAYNDAEGRSGLQYVVQVATQLLSPATSELTATFVGRLITVLIRRAGDHLGDNLDLLLRAVLSKLQVRKERRPSRYIFSKTIYSTIQIVVYSVCISLH